MGAAIRTPESRTFAVLALAELQIRDVVVLTISVIDMMNGLVITKKTTEMTRHHETMLKAVACIRRFHLCHWIERIVLAHQ